MAEDAPPPKAVTRGQRRAAVRVLNELSKEKSLERSRGYPWILDRDARIIICKVLYRKLALLLHTDKKGPGATARPAGGRDAPNACHVASHYAHTGSQVLTKRPRT